MALIKCPDCSKSISANAATCIHCGAPISTSYEKRTIGTDVITTQATSKRLKLLTIVAVVMFWGGLTIMLLTAMKGDRPDLSPIFFVAGSMLYLITKMRSWWHHS